MTGPAQYRRWKACERKRAYPTAEAAAIPNQRVYRCPYCGKFHRSGALTTLANRLRKRP